jgi:sulfate-transporting ATPase
VAGSGKTEERIATFFQFVVIGLGAGAVYALLALGVVVIHRASGVVNFAQGAVAVMAGFEFASLTQAHGWSAGAAFAVVVALAGLLGALVYRVAIRPLRDVSRLTQVMATLAILMILQAIAVLHWSANTVIVGSFLPSSTFSVGKVTVQVSQVILLGIAGVLTLMLWSVGRFTLPGLAVSGSAENRRAVAALGWSPDVLGSSAWMIGCALGAAAGMLIAPFTGVQVNNMTLLLASTLAAALVGGFNSIPLALAGALGIGVGQALLENYVTGIQGAGDAFPFLAIVVVLALRGQGITARGRFAERMADIGAANLRARYVVPVALVLAILMLSTLGPLLVGALMTSLMFGIVYLSIVVLTGYTGQLSLAQLSIGGIGALVAARLVESAHWTFVPAAIAGVAAAILVGLLFALPALRTRGLMLAIVTFGLASAMTAVVFTNGKYVGGDAGTPVGGQSLFGLSINTADHANRYAVLALGAFVVCALVVANVRRGRVGRRLIAVRSNERAAAALGVNVYGIKLYAFGLSAAIAAVGGILLAFQYPIVQYDGFDPFQSLLAVAYTVIGGVGYVAGALYGALLAPDGVSAWLLNKLGTGVEKYLALFGGLALLVTLLANPDGLAREVARLGRAVRTRLPSRAEKHPMPLPQVAVVRGRESTLEVRDLVVRFGGVTAVAGVSLTLRPGRISGLIGPNGAGKTTVIDAVTGLVRPAGGSIVLDAVDITRLPTYRRARAGISRSFQSLELFEGVSVLENLLAASEPRDRTAYLKDLAWPGEQSLAPAAVAAVNEFGLQQDLELRPQDLSYGQRRLVGIARAVASQPSVLLLDEPAAGLDEREAQEIAGLVRRLATSWGIAVLLVEHDMSFVMSVCDDITVIDFGRQIAHGTPEQVRADPAVIAAYLGEPEAEAAPEAPEIRHGAG